MSLFTVVHRKQTRIATMSNEMIPIQTSAPPHQTKADRSFGPGDEYLVWKKMKNYNTKKKLSFFMPVK